MYFKFFTISFLILSPLCVLAIQDNNQASQKDKAKETIQNEFQEALKKYEDKKQLFQTEVLNLFDRKETIAREKGDLKSLNVIKKEKDAFLNTGKEPSLFFITDQKRFMELAKTDLVKAYEKAVKDCIKAKLDFDAEEFAKELEEFKAGKKKSGTKQSIPQETILKKEIFLKSPFSYSGAKTAQRELAKQLNIQEEVKISIGNDLSIEMVLIPPGKYVMGSPPNEKGRKKNENQRMVTITKPFYMGKYEVSQEQWEEIMMTNESEHKSPKFPVTNVSWLDCKDFIFKLNEKTKSSFRLPTEAQWEYACRSGTITASAFGDKMDAKDANCNVLKPTTIGSFRPNNFGLHDMHGGIWEICDDSYEELLPTNAITNPINTLSNEAIVARGGTFDFSPQMLRSAIRTPLNKSHRAVWFGFRLAKDIEP